MKKLKVGLAGVGTVGSGVYEILKKDGTLVSNRADCTIEVVAISARSKKDFVDANVRFYDNAVDLANDPDLDVVVEAIGGLTIAKEVVETALKNGKKVVTANKALLAEHGFELSKLAEENNSYIGFESSVAAATPIVKSFKENYAGNVINEFYGILNGTCNFILTKMKNEGLSFDVVLKEAQELGYAEADPTFDIKGIDTAHKLAILSAISSGAKPTLKNLHIEGVDEVSIEDIQLADEMGYKIKLLAVYKNLGEETLQAVYPALVKSSDLISQIDLAYNAVLTNTSNADWSLVVGGGAGKLPTASAIVADLVDIACNRYSSIFGVKSDILSEPNIVDISERSGKYFLNLVVDKELVKGVDLAQTIFGSKVKIDKVAISDAEDSIQCGFLTGEQKETEILEIFNNFDKNLVKAAKFIRVEETNF